MRHEGAILFLSPEWSESLQLGIFETSSAEDAARFHAGVELEFSSRLPINRCKPVES